VALPGLGAVGELSGRAADRTLYLTFISFTAPAAVYRHDLDADETSLSSPPGLPVPTDAYVTEQLFATSADGTAVPLFLVRRRDLRPTGDAPTLLYGYGGFKVSLTPMFRVPWLVWLERGGVLAVANLRGGGEYGTAWHDAGRLASKQNVFDDFAACAEALVDRGWTRPRRLAIQGASNGGLLVGASIIQRPELFAAAVIEVGVLDMLRFHRFTIGWGWTSDYGSPDDPDAFKALLAYSPLHNLERGRPYPATLITTGDHDDRVVPGHSFKFAAALQAAQGGDRPVLLRVEIDTGHGAGKPTTKAIAERADVLAFLFRALAASE
jgi:prolyl oligopeptidase